MNDPQLESMLLEEDRGWRRLHVLLRSIPTWLAEAARQLDRMREGTYRQQENTVEELNRAWFALSRTLDVPTARAELESARVIARDALGALPTLTTDALGWFEESAWLHYAEHVVDLERWLGA
jgi:hypothetical protein